MSCVVGCRKFCSRRRCVAWSVLRWSPKSSLKLLVSVLIPPTQAFCLQLNWLCFAGKVQLLSKSSSTHAQYVTLHLYFSHPRLVVDKTETGTAKVGRLLIATHLNQSNNPVNQQQVFIFAVAFASLNILCKNAGPKTSLLSQTRMFWLFFIQIFLYSAPVELVLGNINHSVSGVGLR